MPGLIAFAMVLLFIIPANAQDWTLDAPDGRTRITVARQSDGRLVWRVARDKAPILEDASLGLRRADHAFIDGLTLRTAGEPRTIDERYQTPHGKRKDHHVRGRERTLTFANRAGALVDVIMRAHDDGVAVRYRFPETDAVVKRVFDEHTAFRRHVAYHDAAQNAVVAACAIGALL